MADGARNGYHERLIGTFSWVGNADWLPGKLEDSIAVGSVADGERCASVCDGRFVSMSSVVPGLDGVGDGCEYRVRGSCLT